MKLVCWDFNDTIAGYRRVRPNIAEVLAALRDTGSRNVVTTTIDAGYVEHELKKLGLERYFDAVYGGVRDHRLRAKSYAPVVKAMGIKPKTARESVVVIGDKPHDHPADLEGVVFIQNPRGDETDARVIQALLGQLGENPSAGYDAMCQFSFEDDNNCYHGFVELPHEHHGTVRHSQYGHGWLTPEIVVQPNKVIIPLKK